MTLAEIAQSIGAEVEGDSSIEITSLAPIDTAKEGQVSFVANRAYEKFISTTSASALVLGPNISCDHIPVLRHKNPYLAVAHLIDLMHPEVRMVEPGCDTTSVIDAEASVDETAGIGPLCHIKKGSRVGRDTQLVSSVYIGEHVTVGDNCILYPGVRIMNGCRAGNNVIVHSGAIIGSDGFGFAQSDAGHKKIKQVGWVEISDEVEIGANTTIDRGAIGPTKIGRGTKIDNLVQIAHNVEIGENCIIVSQVGISGSTKLGNGVMLAGQVGLVGHIELGDGVQVGAQSGVSKSVPPGKKMFGYPARDLVETGRIEASLVRLPELLKRVRAIENKLKG
ncbi:MAG: UDP-3-O-(3-hydroxymyristoyl)glucosamine N-acyltransferase [Candidatus Zixiibacteriota bacterium]|nr:MAG: UDP-3-O-(3-hydroxymyristoyl)glucosamine N-acyltransferase [candidate division Zixibacteria bacterium]